MLINYLKMTFRKRSRNVGRVYGLNEEMSVETFTHMHELISNLMQLHVPVNMDGFFTIEYPANNIEDNKQVTANKKAVRKAIASKKNLYIYREQKFERNGTN